MVNLNSMVTKKIINIRRKGSDPFKRNLENKHKVSFEMTTSVSDTEQKHAMNK